MKKYALGVYEKAIPGDLSWREKLQAAKDAGYDFMEISIDETDAKLARLEWTREERMELVNLMSEIGLPLRSMCLSGHRKYPLGSPDPAIEARSMEIMEKAISACASSSSPATTSTMSPPPRRPWSASGAI